MKPDQFVFKDETGQQHGEWQVLDQALSMNGARWRCRCSVCGTVRVIYGFTLRAKPPRCPHNEPAPVLP